MLIAQLPAATTSCAPAACMRKPPLRAIRFIALPGEVLSPSCDHSTFIGAAVLSGVAVSWVTDLAAQSSMVNERALSGRRGQKEALGEMGGIGSVASRQIDHELRFVPGQRNRRRQTNRHRCRSCLAGDLYAGDGRVVGHAVAD